MPQSNEEKGFFAQLFNDFLNLCGGCCLTEDDLHQNDYIRRTNSDAGNTQIISQEVLPSRTAFHQDPSSQQRSTQRAHTTQTSNCSTHVDQVRRQDQQFRQANVSTFRVVDENNLFKAKRNHPNEFASRVVPSTGVVLPSSNRKRLDQNYFTNQVNQELILSIHQIEAENEFDQAFKNTNAIRTEVDENDSFGANRRTEPNINHQGQLLREEAQQHFHKFKMFQKNAQMAYKAHNKMLSTRYFALANREKQLFEQANATAAAVFLEENLPRSASQNTIDLHNLYVKEAIAALDIFIDSQIGILRTEKKKSVFLAVITGRGKHSLEGPKIKPAVIKRLIERELKYTLSNPGRLKVLVSNKTLLSHEL